MKTLSTALTTHLAGEVTTLATCLKATLATGKIYGFTTHTSDLVVNGVTYQAAAGYTPTAIASNADLAVDNLEVIGFLNSAVITESDINAGLWDYAAIEIIRVNYADLTMGSEWMRKGTLGQVSTGRHSFIAEMRGMTQPLQQAVGRIVSPSCHASLGDAQCGVNMAGFTVTGSVTSLIDQHRFNDTARTETNGAVTRAISNITNANPAVFTVTASGFAGGMLIGISGVNGMVQMNGVSGILGYIDANRFSLGVDSTNFAAYTSGGLAAQATPSEYFQGGILTWTSGLNIGLKIEVKSYSPGYIFLSDAMVYAIAIGDTYSMKAGCDRLLTTCINRFNNVVNFRGFPHLPGQDRLIAGT
jgi:hypothetical protein